MQVPNSSQVQTVNYRRLRAQKAFLELTVEDLVKSTGLGTATITAAMKGVETVNLQTLIKLAERLGLKVVVDFVPIENSIAVSESRAKP